MLPYFVNEPDRGITARGFPSPFVVYTWDTDALDMPKVNRQVLADMIDKYPELTRKKKK
jgi:hypothetical protein